MNPGSLVGQLVDTFKAQGRVVIVGASLAGLRAAEALRDRGFAGHLTIIGDEQYEPYDRPPLSKQVLKGWVPAHHTKLPRLRPVDAQWRLGVAAVGLDRSTRQVLLANGERVEYDRLLIATGTRARPWFNPREAALEGLFTVRTCDDAEKLAAALKRRPRRVLIVGSGFVGSEIASVCRDLDLPVTVAERGKAPLVGALGGVIGDIAAKMQLEAGVDLRTGVAVEGLEGDAEGHVRAARLSDGTVLDVDVVVASLGSIRNVEWLEGAQLASGFWGGLRCGLPRIRHQRSGDRQHLRRRRRSAGPACALRVRIHVSRALGQRCFRCRGGSQQHDQPGNGSAPAPAAALFLVGAVRRQHQECRRVLIRRRDRIHPGIDRTTSLRGRIRLPRPHRRRGHVRSRQVAALLREPDRAVCPPFPPPPPGYDCPVSCEPMPARFPDPREPTAMPDVVLTGHDPTSRGAEFRPRRG